MRQLNADVTDTGSDICSLFLVAKAEPMTVCCRSECESSVHEDNSPDKYSLIGCSNSAYDEACCSFKDHSTNGKLKTMIFFKHYKP